MEKWVDLFCMGYGKGRINSNQMSTCNTQFLFDSRNLGKHNNQHFEFQIRLISGGKLLRVK